jgi:hypothetical protein
MIAKSLPAIELERSVVAHDDAEPVDLHVGMAGD